MFGLFSSLHLSGLNHGLSQNRPPYRLKLQSMDVHLLKSRTLMALLLAAMTVLGSADIALAAQSTGASSQTAVNAQDFPPSTASYADANVEGLWEVLSHRVRQEPLNLWVTLLFLAAITHTFFTHKFHAWARRLQERVPASDSACAVAHHQLILPRILHFLGEVEAVFGIWCLPLFVLLLAAKGVHTTVDYLDSRVSYIEPVFVVVIMAIASTRPILDLAERGLETLARLGGGGPGAWWCSILTVGPLLGSLITEPAAMTISALLLVRHFYSRKPAPGIAYATLGLLFVNISVGGVLTHFAAPPVLMVAGPWGWGTPFMLRHFGWVALIGILIANVCYYLVFRGQFAALANAPATEATAQAGTVATSVPVPIWVTLIHVAFMAWMVLCAHHPPLMVGGFLFFLAFFEVTQDYQSELQLRMPILVGFFLAGLVIHGGLQQWWIAPVLGRLSEVPLFFGAIALTAFNDNAAITYLSTLVPALSDAMKHMVVAGAVTGGGLTVIANAPNPAGQAILGKSFEDGISPLGLLLGALPATAIMAACLLLFR